MKAINLERWGITLISIKVTVVNIKVDNFRNFFDNNPKVFE